MRVSDKSNTIKMQFDMEVSDIIISEGMKKITATAWWLNKCYR